MSKTYTVSLMAEIETEEGVFEDVILGEFDSKAKAMRAAKSHIKKNPEAQAQVIAASPTEPAFEKMSSLKALIYSDEDFPTVVVTESF